MKKVFIVLAILMLCITVFQIRITYAKYISDLGADANFQVSPWKIIVNDTDITEESKFKSNIIWDTSNSSNAVYYENVEQYKLAPTTLDTGILGYELKIDTSNLSTNVDVKFEIKVDMSKLEDILSESNVNIEDMFELNLKRDGNLFITDYDDSDDLYSNICQDLSKDYLYFGYMKQESTTIDIFFRWIDDGSGKNDEIDTLIGTSVNDLEIPITVTVTQLDTNT